MEIQQGKSNNMVFEREVVVVDILYVVYVCKLSWTLVILKIFALGYTTEHTHSWPKILQFGLRGHPYFYRHTICYSQSDSIFLDLDNQQTAGLSISICCTNHSISPSSWDFGKICGLNFEIVAIT